MASARGGSSRPSEQRGERKSKTPNLDHYSRDLTSLAREGELDPIVGREVDMPTAAAGPRARLATNVSRHVSFLT
jgi:ATP-dependent Clp protease ATP-binding subunit ClpA